MEENVSSPARPQEHPSGKENNDVVVVAAAAGSDVRGIEWEGKDGASVEEVLVVEKAAAAQEAEIASLKEELMQTKAHLARVVREREYFKRKALWVGSEDQKILSEVITSTDHWWERTWLMVHEPIRMALIDIEDLVINTPSFDPVAYPFKVTNFFLFFKGCLAPYIRRHHEAEEKVYFPWIQTKAQIPSAIAEEHTANQGINNLLKDVESSEADYKKLTGTPTKPPSIQELYEWRNRLTTRLQVLIDCLRVHMKEEELYFPAVVRDHFSKKEEDAIVERMGSSTMAHIELPMVVMAMDMWAGPTIKTEFLQRLSSVAKHTLERYWLPTFKKTHWGMLESLALEEPPPPNYVPLLSAPVLIASSPILLLCSIQ